MICPTVVLGGFARFGFCDGWLTGGVDIGAGVLLSYKRIFIIALVVVVVIALYLYLYRSANGRRLRAVMQNREMASALGVRSRTVDAVTFGLGTGLAGVAGVGQHRADLAQAGQIKAQGDQSPRSPRGLCLGRVWTGQRKT